MSCTLSLPLHRGTLHNEVQTQVTCHMRLCFFLTPPLAKYISNCGVLDMNYFNNKSPEGNGKTRANKWIICKVSPHANRERGRATVPDASAYATVQVWSQLLGSWTPPRFPCHSRWQADEARTHSADYKCATVQVCATRNAIRELSAELMVLGVLGKKSGKRKLLLLGKGSATWTNPGIALWRKKTCSTTTHF